MQRLFAIQFGTRRVSVVREDEKVLQTKKRRKHSLLLVEHTVYCVDTCYLHQTAVAVDSRQTLSIQRKRVCARLPSPETNGC